MCCHGFAATPDTGVGIFTCCAMYTCQHGGDGCLLTSAILFLLFPMVGEVFRSCSFEGCSDYSHRRVLQRKWWLKRKGVLVHPSQCHLFPHVTKPHPCTRDFSTCWVSTALIQSFSLKQVKIPTSLGHAHCRNTLPHFNKALGTGSFTVSDYFPTKNCPLE